MTRKSKILVSACGLLVLFSCGLAVRLAVLNAQYSLHGRMPPFTLESALQYRLVAMIIDNGRLPVRDMAVQVPDGVVIRETYTIGSEYVYAVLAGAFPASWPLTNRVRLASILWFCLGIPLMSGWLWFWLRSRPAAFIGGAYYAVSLAAVMRSTGQELSHENFALPLLIAHLAANAFAGSRMRGRMFWPASAISALLLACALATWDLIQFYVLMWTALGFVRFVKGGYFRESRRCLSWLIHLGALIIVGSLNPYHRAHSFLISYAMLLGYGTALGLVAERYFGGTCRITKIALALAPLVIGVFLFRSYGETYAHFTELLWAKLRFLNRKPADPGLLTFAQRVLWTPALNSVNLRLFLMLFPFILPLLVLFVPVLLFAAPWRSDPEIAQVLFFGALSFAAFILFMRFHVFLVIFAAALLGRLVRLGAGAGQPRRFAGPNLFSRIFIGRAGWAVAGLLFFGVAAEAAHTLSRPARWGRGLMYLQQKEELAGWLRENARGMPVLANFPLSPFLLVYSDCPIVLHPKFESPEIRERVREYGEALFLSNESEFRDWADRYGPRLYVFALGEFSPVRPELQMRYFVNAMNPPPDAAALLFDREPENARHLIYLWGNAKYRVFRIIGGSDLRIAAGYASGALEDFLAGDLDNAESKAVLSLAYNPNEETAMKVLLRVESLREQGLE